MKKIIFIILLILNISLSAGEDSLIIDLTTEYTEGWKEFFEQSNYRKALSHLERIKNPDSEYYPSARYLVALIYTNFEKYDSAQIAINEVLNYSRQGNSLYARAQIKAGYIYFMNNQFEEAFKIFKRMSEEHQYYREATIGLLWCYLTQKDHQSVIDFYNTLMEKDPSSELISPEFYFVSGYAYYLSGNIKYAIGLFERADVFHKGLLNKQQNVSEFASYIKSYKKYGKVIDYQIAELLKKIGQGNTEVREIKEMVRYSEKEKERINKINQIVEEIEDNYGLFIEEEIGDFQWQEEIDFFKAIGQDSLTKAVLDSFILKYSNSKYQQFIAFKKAELLQKESEEQSIKYYKELLRDPAQKRVHEFADFKLLGINYQKWTQGELSGEEFKAEIIKYSKKYPVSRFSWELALLQAEISYENREYEKAIREYLNLEQEKEGYFYVNYKLGWCYYFLDDFKQMIEHFHKIDLEGKNGNLIKNISEVLSDAYIVRYRQYGPAKEQVEKDIKNELLKSRILYEMSEITIKYNQSRKDIVVTNDPNQNVEDIQIQGRILKSDYFYDINRYSPSLEIPLIIKDFKTEILR